MEIERNPSFQSDEQYRFRHGESQIHIVFDDADEPRQNLFFLMAYEGDRQTQRPARLRRDIVAEAKADVAKVQLASVWGLALAIVARTPGRQPDVYQRVGAMRAAKLSLRSGSEVDRKLSHGAEHEVITII